MHKENNRTVKHSQLFYQTASFSFVLLSLLSAELIFFSSAYFATLCSLLRCLYLSSRVLPSLQLRVEKRTPKLK